MLVVVVLSVIAGADFLNDLEPSRSLLTLVSLMPISLLWRLISVRVLSVLTRVSLLSTRPIVLPVVLPTFWRLADPGSRTPAIFSVDRLVKLSEPIVRPTRDGRFDSVERRLVAGCLFVTETDESFLPIILPMPRLRSKGSNNRLLFSLRGVTVLVCREAERLFELTAGSFAPVGAVELRVPIVSPIRERRLVAGSFFAFETDGVLELLEPPIRKDQFERAAGRLAPLPAVGLVVLIVLPIREVMLGLIRLFVLVVDLFVIVFRELRLDVFLVPIELPMRDVMLGLILL